MISISISKKYKVQRQGLVLYNLLLQTVDEKIGLKLTSQGVLFLSSLAHVDNYVLMTPTTVPL
jgi:hypothetical protein